MAANTGLGSGDEVDVRGNPLNRASIQTHIPALQSRGVAVEFDDVVTEPVDIPDPNLRAAVEDALGVASGDTITASEMATLTRLEASEAGIRDLTGLEGATNLTRLDLGDNVIRDISVLAGLTNLTKLSLDFNNITDISVLAGLPNLIDLALGYNAITDHSILSGLTNLTSLDLRSTNTSDLSMLSGLTKLERLYIDRNGISDLAPLAGLTNLTRLGLVGNDISDVSPLRGLTNLKWMRLAENNITDLSPLVANTGLGSGDWIDVKENPLNYASIKTHIPTLQSRGVAVEFDDVVTELVDIPDSNLRAAIENALGKTSGATITTADMGKLIRFGAPNANISDLTGLEFATNLIELHLGPERVANEWRNSNAVKDLSPLAGLTQLTLLHLPGNSISDISPVADLTNLTWLNLWGNSISDIFPVAGLTKLTDLYLGDNNISDLSPLVANTGLGNGDTVDVKGNPLNFYTSIKIHIPTLQGRGVTVEFDGTTHSNFGEPRTVRLIYFLPNDRPYRADVVQRMKDEIRNIQTFYAEQMQTHGYGSKTFRVETDSQGEPMVHRVDGQHPNSHYFYYMESKVRDEIVQTFNLDANLYLIVMDTDVLRRNNGQPHGGTGHRYGKIGGYALVSGGFRWETVAHELGHAFGLFHDFREGSSSRHIMSYGRERNQLSACHAEYLVMSPYFNADVPIEHRRPPTIELISSRTYPAGSKSVPIRLKISDSEGLHQALLFVRTSKSQGIDRAPQLKLCRGLEGKTETIVEFDYDGVIPSDSPTSFSNPTTHPISVEAVDMNGNVTRTDFVLFSETFQPLTKLSGDNQTGLPNTPLPVPFVVQVQNVNDGSAPRRVAVTFTVTAGGGMLTATSTITDENNRAQSTLTLGPNLGTTTVEVSAAGIEGTVTFTAVAGAAVDIPDPNLRAAVEINLGKAEGDPIASAEMETLTHLQARNANISDLTGLEFATNLTSLDLGYGEGGTSHAVKDLSPLADLTQLTRLHLPGKSISDISAVTGLTNLTWLNLWGNPISDISPVAGLTNLINLYLGNNNISDLSPLVANTGLGSGDTVNVRENPLSYASINTHIPALLSRGVAVEFDDVVAEPVDIPDPNLRAAIENALGKPAGAPITVDQMAALTRLEAPNANISDLTGLEHATNLTSLDLGTENVEGQGRPINSNSVSDLSPLAGLTNLTWLRLRNNSISDISALSGLTNLTWLNLGGNLMISDISALSGLTNLEILWLYGNSLSDLSPLAGLTNLAQLTLWFNSISDLSPLAGLTNLTSLGLYNNLVSDISPLAGLTNLISLGLSNFLIVLPTTGLTHLSLNNNSISDLSPLVANTGLEARGLFVDVRRNPLSDASIHTHIPALQNRGVTVEFARTPTTLLKISGTVTELDNLLIVEVRDNRNRPFEGLPVTFTVISGGGTLSATSATTDGNGRAESRLTLGPDTGTNRVRASAEGISESVTFSDVPEPAVDIPDPNLRAAIERTLGKASGDPITASDMTRLTNLSARNANISDLTGLEQATNLTWLSLGTEYVEAEERSINSNSVSDISPLAGLTNLTILGLGHNAISDISPVAGLTNLTELFLGNNAISDISPLAGLINLTTRLYLSDNAISDISPLAGLTNLTTLYLDNNAISDISPLAGLTNLTRLYLSDNAISDISPLAGLINLTTLWLGNNSVSDLSPLAGLTNLRRLELYNNLVSDLSPLAGLTNLTVLYLSGNAISNLSPLAGLTNLTVLFLGNNSISDISPLVANTGLGEGDTVNVDANPLNSVSINTHIPALQNRGVGVSFSNLKPTTLEFLWSIPAGASWIHVPLQVTAVDGTEKTIESIVDLYDALGGVDTVNLLTTHDPTTQSWHSYLGGADRGTIADPVLTDDKGVIAVMKNAVSVHLEGDALGTSGNSSIMLHPGPNLVGVPLRDSKITRVSDLFALEGIAGNVSAILVSDNRRFKIVRQAGETGDIPIVGGQAFILMAQQAETVTISGNGWTNTSTMAAAPPVGNADLHSSLTSMPMTDTTPVLALRGSIASSVGEWGRMPHLQRSGSGFRVIVKNLSTDRAVAAVTGPDEVGYRLTVVDIKTGQAATIGDTLEISAQSPNPFIGVKPLRYTITAEDVKRNWIQLPELVTYEIPAETELLTNYPNPFNPETWIPYRLAEDAFVTLTIYDRSGQIVRTLDVGHQIAAVYESRSKAVYWDGRNGLGEQVASGVYFYHLSAGDYAATRKMLIIK